MKASSFKTMIGAVAIMLFAASTADACTGVKLKTKDGKTVHGRTLEFGVEVETSLIAVPENYQFVGKTNNGDGMEYISKYAMSGIITYTDIKYGGSLC